MKIDATKLREMYLQNIKLIAKDERFYQVPFANKYVISTYGRLFEKTADYFYKPVKVKYKNKKEYYEILLNDQEEISKISVSKLLGDVFFDGIQIFRLYPRISAYKRRWRIEDLIIVESREQWNEILLAKMERRKPNISENLTKHRFVGRWIPDSKKSVPKALNIMYTSMRTRAMNPNFKALKKQYANTTLSDEWKESPAAFKQYWLDHQYYYPGKISVDKDIMGFGNTNHYAKNLVIEIPIYINDIFTRGTSRLGYCITPQTKKNGDIYYKIPSSAYYFEKREDNIFCNSYIEALKAGRKKKADYIRKIVKKEKESGFIPQHILNTMSTWADLCENGQIKMWEPSEDVLKEMGVK